MEQKFSLKETIRRNIGFILKSLSSIMLFIIGIIAIDKSIDQFVALFLTLIWCYIFFTHLKFRPRIIYKNKKGDILEY